MIDEMTVWMIFGVAVGIVWMITLARCILLVWLTYQYDFDESGHFPAGRWLAHGCIKHLADPRRYDRYVLIKLPHWRWIDDHSEFRPVKYVRQQAHLVWTWRYATQQWSFSRRWWMC